MSGMRYHSCFLISGFYRFHTSFAMEMTCFILFHCSSSVRMLPSSVLENPHCGLRDKFSNGIDLLASAIFALIVSEFSNSGNLEVTKPKTTVCSRCVKLFNGSKLPERLSSYSTKSPSTSKFANIASEI